MEGWGQDILHFTLVLNGLVYFEAEKNTSQGRQYAANNNYRAMQESAEKHASSPSTQTN